MGNTSSGSALNNPPQSATGSGKSSGSASTGTSSTSIQPVGTQPPALPIALSIDFELITPDGLRRVEFGLEKDTDGTRVNWTITFILSERANSNADFEQVASLHVLVASALQDAAATAATNGLTPAQTAHATGPAAEAVKAVNTGELPPAAGGKIVQNTLKVQG